MSLVAGIGPYTTIELIVCNDGGLIIWPKRPFAALGVTKAIQVPCEDLERILENLEACGHSGLDLSPEEDLDLLLALTDRS